MRLSAIVARLAGIADLAGPVAIAINVRAVLAVQADGPRIWIVEPRGQGGRNEVIGAVAQQREQRFGVLTLVTGEPGDSDEVLIGKSEALRDRVYDILLGFRPQAGWKPIEYVRDGLVSSADAHMYWLDEFVSGHQIQSN